ILWGEGEHVARRVGYMEAMERLYEQYPDDSEVAAFYALSMLSAVAATGDLSQRLNIKAGTITLRLFNENPNHPGAPHYTIHAFDNPLHAPLALQSAYRFSEIAPAVSHARHMPTHIFIQHGMWDRVSGNNESAYQAAQEQWRPGDSMGDAIHALDWGQYGDLQRGDYEKARLWIERIETMSGQGGFMEGGARGAAGAARAVNTLSLLKSRYIVDTEEWMIQPVTDESSANELLATGLSDPEIVHRISAPVLLLCASKLPEETLPQPVIEYLATSFFGYPDLRFGHDDQVFVATHRETLLGIEVARRSRVAAAV
ncbi:MAG: hypothetical protein IH987_19305, partial [Planctomycetes bacterium]|nr:hypothetical protein [Planctomycetota bacterium]